MSNDWIFKAINKDASKKEIKKEAKKEEGKQAPANWLKEIVSESYETQAAILSDMNLAEKLTELELQPKNEVSIPEKWSALYMKNIKSVESNRKAAEKKLIGLLKGDYSMLIEKTEGTAKVDGKYKISDQEKKSKKSKEVNEKNYDTGRNIIK